MLYLPNEILNRIFSFKETSPVCKIMRERISEYNDILKNYKTKRRFNSFYFHTILRYKIDQILKKRGCFDNLSNYYYEAVESELWMLSYYDINFDYSVFDGIKKHSFRNMDFSMGYRVILISLCIMMR